MRKTLSFKTNTLLKNLVGKDLINDDNIAIVELVKNGYDAGADEVIVRFTELKGDISTDASQIIVFDKGNGMDLADIQDKWLNIAYSEKTSARQNKGAFLAGNKGIGRFSCDRLGRELDLLTRKRNGRLLHLHIDWSRFEVEGDKDLTIQEIELEVESVSAAQAAKLAGLSTFPVSGTALVISQLRNSWDVDRLRKVKTVLERFQNPNQLYLRKAFRVVLSVPSLEAREKELDYPDRINGPVQNQIFEKLKFNATYIDAALSPDGRTITVDLYHEGDRVFQLIEENRDYELLSDVHVVVYYLNSYKKAYFKRQTGVRLVDFGSIFLFLNGFRVAPYGDRGDDWLGLDIRKAQGTSRYFGSRDIVGRIEIESGNEDQFKPISSREGLKNTAAFQQLRSGFALDVLKKLERFVVDGLDWDSVPGALRQELNSSEGLDWNQTAEQYSETWDRKKQRIAFSIMNLLGSSPDRISRFWFNPTLLEDIHESRREQVKLLLDNIEEIPAAKIDPQLSRSLNKFRKIILDKENEVIEAKASALELRAAAAQKDQKISRLEAANDTYRAQTMFFQQITSVDVKQLLAYHHQISLDATIANNYIEKLGKALKGIEGSSTLIDLLQKIALANKRIVSVAQYATKANFRSGVKKESTDLPAFFEQYLLNVAKDFVASGLNLIVDNEISEQFEVKASRLELSVLIDNIVSNANKALARNLKVEMRKTGPNTVRISFVDDGKGLSKDLPSSEAMFDLGVTTTSGSGFGLYHARQAVESFGGIITAVPLKRSGMEIRIEVTR